jgi:hypothetical protein
MKFHRNGAIAPGIFQHVTTIGREYDVGTDPFGRFPKGVRLITSGVRKEKKTRHC